MNLLPLQAWRPSGDALSLRSIDCHTAGEPLRVITEGFPALQGQTMLERRRDCQQRFDHLRRALMWEPRGHADMYGALITPPEDADSAFGVDGEAQITGRHEFLLNPHDPLNQGFLLR